MSQARFQKQQREKARREKAAAKFARKAERAELAADPSGDAAPAAVDQEQVLAELATLHERFAAGTMEFEEFEDAKAGLLEQLRVQ